MPVSIHVTERMRRDIRERELVALESTETRLRVVDDKLQQLKASPVNVAVVGRSVVGKSSFVNAIRNLEPDDENAAPVGEFKSTSEIGDYLHPTVPGIKLWDLPGVGSAQFPKKTYLENVHFDTYDFFILITAERYTETDTWLGQEIRNREKNYFLVRAKIDRDVYNDRVAHPNSHDEHTLIDTIHQHTRRELTANGSVDVPVFLISNYDRTKYDFQRLEQQLIQEVPAIKRNSIMLCKLRALGDIMKTVERQLRLLLWFCSALSAACVTCPWYFMFLACLAGLTFCWNDVCGRQFGLDDSSLDILAGTMSVCSRKLKDIVERNFEDSRRRRFVGMAIGFGAIPAIRQLMAFAFTHRYFAFVHQSPHVMDIATFIASLVCSRGFFGGIMKVFGTAAAKVRDAVASEIRKSNQNHS